MARKRLTEMFPFLLPLRRWQKKQCCYLKMKFDKNVYADKISESLFPNVVFETSALMVNENSGFDIQFQYNKVHNLQLAAKTMDKLVIAPNETFSFFWLTRHADRYTRYKDGLNLVNGKIVGSYGGGLCQLSNMLFWLFLHTPMTIVERHGHAAESFPSTTEDLPCGTDARAGSSFGITKVTEKEKLSAAIALAFEHDTEVIVEEAIDGFEVGCAILGNDVLTVGRVDEIELLSGFFDYTEKYTLKTSQIHMPARIDATTEKKIQDTALRIYKALGCSGFARVDLFLSANGNIVFNEVNTIPGLTSHSRYPNMMKGIGLSFAKMLDRLIGLYIAP